MEELCMNYFFCVFNYVFRMFVFQDPREKLILSLKKEIKVLRNENHYLREQVGTANYSWVPFAMEIKSQNTEDTRK